MYVGMNTTLSAISIICQNTSLDIEIAESKWTTLYYGLQILSDYYADKKDDSTAASAVGK